MIGDDDEPVQDEALPPISDDDKADLGFGKPVTEAARLERNRKIVLEQVEVADRRQRYGISTSDDVCG